MTFDGRLCILQSFCPATIYPMHFSLLAMRHAVATLLLLTALAGYAHAQSNMFRDARAHLGLSAAWFTYYGPIDLRFPESTNNYIQNSDPAAVLLGSFPISTKRAYFRVMLGLTNFSKGRERTLIGPNQNEFIYHTLFWFEPEVVLTLFPNSRSRFMPYVYSGFGGLLADPFNEGRADRGGFSSDEPGPDRSVFVLPLGAGIDVAVTDLISFFVEGSYRFNFNYVIRNEGQRNPHNTSLFMAGLRVGLRGEEVAPERVADPIGPLPPPLDVPPYDPPRKEPLYCTLVELNSVYFSYDGTTLDDEARTRLSSNVDALRSNPQCCVDIIGWTDEAADNAYMFRIAQQRANVVYQFYLDNGIDPQRMRVRSGGRALPPCEKDEEGGPGCRRNRRVDSEPLDCGRFLETPRR